MSDRLARVKILGIISGILGVLSIAGIILCIHSLSDIWWEKASPDFNWSACQIGFLPVLFFHVLMSVTLFRLYKAQNITRILRTTSRISVILFVFSFLGTLGQMLALDDIQDGTEPDYYLEWLAVMIGYIFIVLFHMSTSVTLFCLFKQKKD